MFTISDGDFLDEFFKCTEHYIYSTFHEINHSILNDTKKFYSSNFSQIEIATLVVLNKAIFQNITGFIVLIENKLPLPAFNALRATIEAMRLFRAVFIDEEFRKEYIQNQNMDFANTPDYQFMQKKVNKVLEKKEKEIRSKEKIPYTFILSNHDLVSNSGLSNLHSELSKWSHVLNINLLMPTHINSGKIYLGIDDEFEKPMQTVIKKYIEASYLIISSHEEIFTAVLCRKEFLEEQSKMIDLYSKYIEKFY